MKKNSIIKNYFYNLSYQILIIILPVITIPYLSRVLGVENIGIYSYTVSITAYFILIGTLGIAMYGEREVAYLQNDKYGRSKIFWEIIIIRTITLSIAMIMYFFIHVNDAKYSTYYLILLLEFLAVYFDNSWFLQGLEEFRKTVTRSFIVKICSVLLIFILVRTKDDLWKYVFIYGFSNLIGNISLCFYLVKLVQFIKIKEIELKKHIKPIIYLFIPQIALQIYNVLDKVMIGKFLDNVIEVGYYEQSQKIIKLLLTIITSLGIVMLPRISNDFAKGRYKEISKQILKSFRITYFLTFPMSFGLIIIANDFVPIFFGLGYDKVSVLLMFSTPLILIMGMSNILGIQYLLPTKRQGQYTKAIIVGLIVNVISNIILIPKLLSIGAIISTILAELIILIIEFYYIRREMDIKQILIYGKNYAFAAIFMFIIGRISDLIALVGLQKIIIEVLICSITYFLILFFIKDEIIFWIISNIHNKVKKITRRD